jgi:flagellar motility protein MotE (MotC chaperone)
MKKILSVLTLTLAMNFLALAGGIGWLVMSGKLDREKIALIRELLFPAPPPAPEVLTTQPTTRPTSGPSAQLDELLAKYSGRRVDEQVELVQQSIDAQAAALDRRSRELDHLMAQILREKSELTRKSTDIDAERKRLADREQQQIAQASDKGFQDSLKLYTSMPPKNAKSAFMSMPDEAVARYLQSMSPRTATKIIKEFKSPDEMDRINRVMERLRSGNATTQPAAPPAIAGPNGPRPIQGVGPPVANQPAGASPAASLPKE